ncbi:anti-repressor SinI family protein [Paenibacillus typhae]|uniref:anti-repressor SinI family protein n=1 Tax=Paenibacillus TaxID=44249 RepID=UPI0009E93456|nr:anti-repressor SinI family protein [Paenibacillus typhae]MDF9840922.1 DNA-binding transcriptional MerR regulator [Paenibacillus sp. PastF-2]MDF9847506.1 DNA-binding transcriptional MerR regulator [Paenibacillus sp. PastM-2]MDF9853918.1 DNA-binding transcriptional MerR regulator [Paenibacillus sp. PastF-1]MDH6479189.1 DNA-binding transcriptional MerR regulator [Paenibacillus sp. PastH-2]MDH6507074.1 DNA-binding transcriptional MerR regulator [Paenibacillus sp. PastM-3]
MDKSNQGNVGELQTGDLDLEWVYLMMAARKAGLKVEEIRRFLSERALQAM